MRAPKLLRRSGFTLLELLMVLSLLGIILVKATMLMSTSSDVIGKQSAALVLEDHARIVLDRIALAVMSCDRDSLAPVIAEPGHGTELRYQISLGVEDGEVVWADAEEISFEGIETNQIIWRRNPDLAAEKRVAWSNLVRPFLEGELANGVDDNGNGLVDEEGLSFTIEKNSVTIRLSFGQTLKDGQRITTTLETVATCRNNPLD